MPLRKGSARKCAGGRYALGWYTRLSLDLSPIKTTTCSTSSPEFKARLVKNEPTVSTNRVSSQPATDDLHAMREGAYYYWDLPLRDPP